MNVLYQYPLLAYALRMTLISAICYGYYKLFLADRHFHQFSRFFLLGTPLLSLALPFIRLPFGGYLWQSGRDIPALSGGLHAVTPGDWHEADAVSLISPSTGADLTMLTAIAYILIALVLFYLFLRQLRYIYLLTKTYPAQRLGNIRFFNTRERDAPFSFLNRIFWNDELDIDSPLGKQVLRHEMDHVRQKHSLDLLLLRPLTALCWINPFFHLICREIKAVHEFLADRKAVGEGDKYQYAESLVWHSVRNPPSLLHPFFQSPIKRRITMITQRPKTKNALLRKAMILPLLFLLCCAFAAKRYAGHSAVPPSADAPITVVIDPGHGGSDPGGVNKDGVEEKGINLALSEKINRLAGQYNVRVILTRDKDELAGGMTDKRESLEYRAKLANDNKADLFIAIHTDVQPSADAKGMSVYVAENNSHYAQCVEFGSDLTASLKRTYDTDTALKKRKENIYVLRSTNMPAVLLTVGNINNANDLAFLQKEDNQEKVARNVLEAARTYAKTHPARQ